MILHLVPDEKFIDFAFGLFDKVTSDNRFMAITNSDFKYIKTKKIEKLSIEDSMKKTFIDSLSKYDFVVIHGFTFNILNIVLKASVDIRFVWLGWGFDYYDIICKNKYNKLLLIKTFRLWIKNNKKLFFINSIKNLFPQKTKKIEAIRRIKYFAPVLPNEYEMIKKAVKGFDAKYITFSYADIGDCIKGLSGVKGGLGPNVLLGNSSTYTNNHLEAIDLLSYLKIDERRIVTPLSYGDEKYRDCILDYGFLKLGKNFSPLTDFLHISDYNEILVSCSVVVMNHIRQQAMGNIIWMMYLGAKVYLHPKSPAFIFFETEGAHVFSTETLNVKNTTAFDCLSQQEVSNNRHVLEQHWSVVNVENKVINLLDVVMSNR